MPSTRLALPPPIRLRRVRPYFYSVGVPELSEQELRELIEEATVDAYDEEEQRMGFAAMLETHLELPFVTTVLGVKVEVESVTETENSIVAICVRGTYRQPIALEDLPLPDPEPEGSEWIAAYRRWVGRR